MDSVLDMIEHSAGYMEECIAFSAMVEGRIEKVYDNANNIMNDTALHLQSLFHGLPSTRGCQAERRQRLATLRERFEAENPRKRRRVNAETALAESVEADAAPSSGRLDRPQSTMAEFAFNRPAIVLDAD